MNKKFWILIIVVVGGLIGLFAIGQRGAGDQEPQPQPRLGTKIEELGRDHIAVGQSHEPYNSNPPTSGPHYAQPADWGVSDQPLPDETLVHNLEHGGIIISYRPDLPADQIEEIKNFYRDLPTSAFGNRKAVIVPRSANERPLSLTAWGYLLHLDAVDKNQIRQFYLDHVDKGPEKVP